MKNTLLLKGVITTKTAIIDPNLPRSCKKHWIATGALVHEALKHSYLSMVERGLEGDSMPIDEAYLILAGKIPTLRQKRTQVGRNYLLAKHNNALSLFGSLSQGIEGRLKVGFISKADETGKSKQNIRIVDYTEADISLLISVLNEWSNNTHLGENTEIGFGEFEAYWQVFLNDSEIGFISLKQGVMEHNFSFEASEATCC